MFSKVTKQKSCTDAYTVGSRKMYYCTNKSRNEDEGVPVLN